MIVRNQDEAFRWAIWEVYRKRCFYTSKLIESLDDLHIDHIIPNNCEEELFQKKKNDYSFLPTGFDRDSIQNKLPTLKKANGDKGSDCFNEENERFYLEIALKNSSKIKEAMARYENNYKKERLRSHLRHHQNKLNDLNKLYNNYDQKFEIMNQVIEGEYENSCFVSSEDVRIVAYLPHKYDVFGGMLSIEFSGNVNSMITMDHEEILDLINVKKGEGEIRSSIVRSSFSPDGSEKSFITFNNFADFILNNQVDSLILILEKFLDHYNHHYLKVLGFHGASGMKVDPEQRGFVIGQVNRITWRSILKFAKEYDYDNGSSEWHIFNSKSSHIIVDSKKIENYHTIITPYYEPSIVDIAQEEDWIDIVWNLPSTPEYEGVYSEGEFWDAKTAKDWFFNKLVLKVQELKKGNRENLTILGKLINYFS